MSATAARISAPPLSAVQRYFEISLYLLVLTSVLAVVTTGKLDPFSTAVPSVALAYKGSGSGARKGPELSVRLATWLVLAYFLFFPFDLWVISRNLAAGAPIRRFTPRCSRRFICCFSRCSCGCYSARTNRDFAFLAVLAFAAILASAILTDRNRLPHFARDFSRAWPSPLSSRLKFGAARAERCRPARTGNPAWRRQLNRALGLTSIFVAIGTLVVGSAFSS